MDEEPAQDLFRSAELRAFRVGNTSDDRCVVTFGSFTDDRTLDRPGFGEAFFRRHGIDAIHVLTRDNSWYQHPELRPALDTVAAAVSGYGRVLAYGSSMGAFAALRFGGWAGAHCALALSPQFSIDPKVMRSERRWPDASTAFRPVWERAAFATPPEAYVAFDPLDQDRLHVARLSAECGFLPIPLQGAGHPVTAFLAELGLLQRLVLSACDGRVDVPALLAEAYRRREESPRYFVVKAARTAAVLRRIEWLERALQIAPGHANALSRMGVALARCGRYAEAIERHRQALANQPGQPLLALHYSQTLERSGDVAGALAVMEATLPRVGETALFVRRVESLRVRLARRKWRRSLLGAIRSR